jgi:HTH-type transcriptional regulator, competence development regulator
MSDSIGARIKELRERKEWSQRELADRVEINYSVINRIELDKRPVKDHEISKFADVFSVSTDFLVGKKNKSVINDDTYDSLAEITKTVKDLGLEQFGFFDIEKWKNLSPEDVDEIRRHFEWVAQKAKERNEEK